MIDGYDENHEIPLLSLSSPESLSKARMLRHSGFLTQDHQTFKMFLFLCQQLQLRFSDLRIGTCSVARCCKCPWQRTVIPCTSWFIMYCNTSWPFLRGDVLPALVDFFSVTMPHLEALETDDPITQEGRKLTCQNLITHHTVSHHSDGPMQMYSIVIPMALNGFEMFWNMLAKIETQQI